MVIDSLGLLREMSEAIMRAGLGRTSLAGAAFRFASTYGSHFQVMEGVILGVILSENRELRFEISNRKFWGRTVDCLVLSPVSGWHVRFRPIKDRVSVQNSGGETLDEWLARGSLPGQFRLL